MGARINPIKLSTKVKVTYGDDDERRVWRNSFANADGTRIDSNTLAAQLITVDIKSDAACGKGRHCLTTDA